jgi:hypothetical protein
MIDELGDEERWRAGMAEAIERLHKGFWQPRRVPRRDDRQLELPLEARSAAPTRVANIPRISSHV